MQKVCLFFLSFNMFSWMVPNCGFADGVCVNNMATLDCVKNNFNEAYVYDYKNFWKIINSSGEKAVMCNKSDDLTNFMRLIEVRKSSNAEFEEYYSQTIEKVCVENDKCFFEAMTQLSPGAQISIVKLLKAPLFQDTSLIFNVFLHNKNNKKYKKLADLYFKPELSKPVNKPSGLWARFKRLINVGE